MIEYNRAFHEKWVAPDTGRTDEPFLGSSDIQSLDDLGNSFPVHRRDANDRVRPA